ncbi:MAG: hypothetical protein PVJ57_04635 [Phycisphaerae bacterium]|jgi:hypothetical protein
MPDQVDSTKLVTEQAAQALGLPAEELIFAGIESAFPWIKFGEIIWARTVDFRPALFWVISGAEPRRLNGGDEFRALSLLLLEQAGPLPMCVSATELAEAIRKLTVEPRGYVGCQAFLDKHTPYLPSWLKRDTPAERAAFAKNCEDPELVVAEDGQTWTLRFFYFNTLGGVEQWEAAGTRDRIQSAKMTTAVRDGVFRYPMR